MAGMKETAGRLGWFVTLWIGGVACLAVVAYLIRAMIM